MGKNHTISYVYYSRKVKFEEVQGAKNEIL
jgi:hypothetical protein